MTACRINLRGDQHASEAANAQNDQVRIFAFKWVRQGLLMLGEKLDGVKFEVRGKNSSTASSDSVLESFTVNGRLSLRQLQMIARNEPRNTSGVITTSYYDADICEEELILALKDLVRQTVIVGLDETVAYGGFPKFMERVPQKVPVYICDLSALQFQQSSNSGRLVTYRENGREIGFLDEFIFKNVVGEPRRRFREVERDISGRYECIPRAGVDKVYFDTVAYMKFIEQDVLLSGLAVNRVARRNKHKVHFKFLNYGTGHFAGQFGPIINKHVLPAVAKGLKLLFKHHTPKCIKSLEFPFYKTEDKAIQVLEKIKLKYKIEYKFSEEDALKMTAPNSQYVIATTNCANPHSPIGNATSFGSIDGSIVNNLKSRGNSFCPSLNRAIKYKFLSIKPS